VSAGDPPTLYLGEHRWQYQPGASLTTRRSGCTWTTAANGLDASTGGRLMMTPDQVHALVKRTEETDPSKPGWSLGDTGLAMRRLGIPFDVRQGWDNLVRAVTVEGCYVTVPGDSEVFTSGCSGSFDGDHNLGVSPYVSVAGQATIDDPICATRRAESWATLRRYAQSFDRRVPFGVWTQPVPEDAMPIPALPVRPDAPALFVVHLSQGTQLLDLDLQPISKAPKAQDVAGLFATGKGHIAIAYPSTLGFLRQLLVAAATPHDPVPAPDCSACQVELSAAQARIRQAIDVLEG
jgi:hypothetical protein